ncbi:MAG: NAD(P)/FAD-dependent oxidoreductase [Rhodospirillaceae bacterium]|nr:NAD(P)/FAD-dependent oxidoreductase [Rhodospirillaceae bacterium]
MPKRKATLNTYDVIIIGAGAAGLMCAVQAGKRGRTVLVLDHAQKVGEKIRISGGGRCNFTNLHVSPENFLSENPHFCVSALSRYTPADFIALVDAHGIAWHEKTLGQLFCDGPAQQIIDMLLAEAGEAGVTIQSATAINGVTKKADGFHLDTDHGAYNSRSLVVACGGPSIPKIGATGFGYDIARQFGLNVITPRAGLVGLTFDDDLCAAMKKLAGVSQDVSVSCGKARFREALLFTHRGLSGPAILQISSYWSKGQEIAIDLAPGVDVFALLKDAKQRQPKQSPASVLADLLPKRLARAMAGETNAPDQQQRLADIPDRKLQELARTINDWRVTPKGSEGYRSAEVTVGGVDTNELSSKTFEARKMPGLYFIGEVTDVTGHLGGFNFQWAWASGFAAGGVV